ncbi:MAG: NAD(P)/FAD-dependent oxidoreductase [Candidatus Hodarchaeales archaeon]|jgi:geranylgeranyl reductase family protein
MMNSSKSYDIIIVGAGPGGGGAAIHAIQNGYSVCLIEKEKMKISGRYKACGGAIDWKMVKALDYPEEKIERVIDTLELHHVDGENYSKKGTGAVVWRSVFDKYLTDKAVEQGVVLKENEPLVNIERQEQPYEISTTKGRYRAKYVLAADGVSSPTLRTLQWPRFAKEDLIMTITDERGINKQKIEQHLGKSSLHLYFSIKSLSHLGYGWLFPKNQQLTVGWGNQLIRVKNTTNEFKALLNLPTVKACLKNSTTERIKGHLIPVGIRPQMWNENVYAIGDAGGFVDPISGKGIPYAIQSGQIAINTIKQCENKDLLDNQGQYYEEVLNKTFLQILKKKKDARERIYQDDQTLKQFLTLWEKYRSSEIVRRGLI